MFHFYNSFRCGPTKTSTDRPTGTVPIIGVKPECNPLRRKEGFVHENLYVPILLQLPDKTSIFEFPTPVVSRSSML